MCILWYPTTLIPHPAAARSFKPPRPKGHPSLSKEGKFKNLRFLSTLRGATQIRNWQFEIRNLFTFLLSQQSPAIPYLQGTQAWHHHQWK